MLPRPSRFRNRLAQNAIPTLYQGPNVTAYPVAVYIMGITPAGIFVYVVPFLISTIAGSILAFLLITALNKSGVMAMIKTTR